MARGRHNKKIDFTSWMFSATGGSLMALAAGTVGFNWLTAGTAPATLMRIRGSVMAWVDGTATPTESCLISVGLIVMPEGQGTTIVSSPFTDGNAPWLWHTTFVIGYEEPVADVVDVPGLTSYREVIDSKAMRIIRPDREVQLVAENTTIDTATTVNIHVSGRILLGF